MEVDLASFCFSPLILRLMSASYWLVCRGCCFEESPSFSPRSDSLLLLSSSECLSTSTSVRRCLSLLDTALFCLGF